MKTFSVIQDGDELETFHDAISAATFLRSIAQAMSRDAENFEQMANAVETSTDSVTAFRWEGSYLDLCVEVG